MRIVNDHLQYPKASLVEPGAHGYIHLAGEVGAPSLIGRASRAKRRLLSELKGHAASLMADEPEVTGAHVFTAAVIPPDNSLDRRLAALPPQERPVGGRPYVTINHCRWDHLRDIVPHLALRPSLRKYVVANFEANGIIPMPILYRLA